ncbi:MAG: nuclear transport factor 2 family protein [Planctomycetota bacterium]
MRAGTESSLRDTELYESYQERRRSKYPVTSVETVERFLASINAHDVDGLAAMMTPDHQFIDSAGARVQGADSMREAWRAYFEMMPDYQITVSEILEKGQLVVVLGQAAGTLARNGRVDAKDRWVVPAAWAAVVVGDAPMERVASWQIFADNSRIETLLRTPAASAEGGAR